MAWLRERTSVAALALAAHACGGPATERPAVPSGSDGRLAALRPMSVPRATHTATLLRDGRVLIVGGFDNAGNDHASAELFDPAAASFLPAARMQAARTDHTATLLEDGKVLVIGGYAGAALASAEIYDPFADRFERTGSLATPRNGHKAVRLKDGRVLVVGGDIGGTTFLASSEIYDPKTEAFSTTGAMAVARSSHTATLLPNGQVLVTGGHQGRQASIQIHATAELYDPESGTFRPTGSMIRVRHKHDAALLANGRVLIVGGADSRDDQGAYSSTEVWEPGGRFSDAGEMRFERYKNQGTTVTLPSGQVLVAGGAVQVELYEPAGARFDAVPGDLGDRPLFAAATLLLDGRVLITGGYGLHSFARANAWIFVP